MASYRNIAISAGILTACSRCGCSDAEILEVHHRDRNRQNNQIENLEPLCPNCHKREHKLRPGYRHNQCKKDIPEKVFYAVRFPSVLLSRIKQRAQSEHVSAAQVVIAACREYLDKGSNTPAPIASPEKPTIDSLRSLISEVERRTDDNEDDHVASVCGFRAYNDTNGEWYTCGLEKHSPKLKHGNWKIDQ